MGNMMKGKQGGLMYMILAIVGLVLSVTMFQSLMTYITTAMAVPNASAYIGYTVVVGVTPTLLLLLIIGGGGWLYKKGYQQTVESGGSIILAVMGILEIILFVALFPTIMTALEAVRTLPNIGDFIALQVVVQIVPVILWLGGIIGGGATAVGGVKTFNKKKAGAGAGI